MSYPTPQLDFVKVLREEKEALFAWLNSEAWPFHGSITLAHDEFDKRWDDGYYMGDHAQAFWIMEAGERIGYIRPFDLTNVHPTGTPLFDIRIKEKHRRRGVGKETTKWVVDWIFTNYPNVLHVGGSTRYDNWGMRRIFEATGFAQESHWRKVWPRHDGVMVDGTGYSITRSDWENGTVTPPDWNNGK